MTVCTLCKNNNSIFTRPYSGERLCRRCFYKSIESKVRTIISKYEMLKPYDKVMVAVSGGKDSVTLLHILARIEKRFPNAKLCAVTIDEGIKLYRNEAMKIAKKNCLELDIEHFIISFDELFGYKLDDIVNLTRGKGFSPCSYCGVLRRRALNIVARKHGVDKLATAHSLDDETQTMILNILHGNVLGIARVKPMLKAVHPKLIQRIKPLCQIPEKEIALYAYFKGIDFQSISCPYSETALRSDIRTMLNRMERKHPGIKFTIFRSMERVRPALETMVKEAKIQECKMCGEPSVGELCQPCKMLQELSVI